MSAVMAARKVTMMIILLSKEVREVTMPITLAVLESIPIKAEGSHVFFSVRQFSRHKGQQ